MGQTVLIIGNAEHQIDQKFQTALSTKLAPLTGIRLQNRHYDELIQSEIDAIQPDLILSIGIKAAHKVRHLNIPTLFTFLPEVVSQQIRECPKKTCPKPDSKFFIVLDQPIERQLKFVKLAFPQTQSIGVLTSDFSKYKIPDLIKIGRQNQLLIEAQWIRETEDINYAIRKFISRKFDILLSLPDPLIHNNKTIPYLLLSTYNQNIPVIGFSETYVNAGAIGAIYSTIEQLAEQSAETAISILQKKYPIKKQQKPKYFNVALNQHVAKSLGLYLADESVLKEKLYQAEQ